MPLLSMLQFNLLKPIEQRSAESDQQKINFGQQTQRCNHDSVTDISLYCILISIHSFKISLTAQVLFSK